MPIEPYAPSWAARLGWALVVMGPLAVTLLLPFYGLFFSILPPIFARKLGPKLWPGTSKQRAMGAGFLASGAFWAALVLGFKIGLFTWFAYWVVPLCAPKSASFILETLLVGLAFYIAGSVASVRSHRPWVWATGSWVTVTTMALLSSWLVHTGAGFVC